MKLDLAVYSHVPELYPSSWVNVPSMGGGCSNLSAEMVNQPREFKDGSQLEDQPPIGAWWATDQDQSNPNLDGALQAQGW
jgi:hypothetical protein